MKKISGTFSGLRDFIHKEEKTINVLFLGVGLTLFVINLGTMLSFMPTNYSNLSFNISIFGSILIVVYAIYRITEK